MKTMHRFDPRRPLAAAVLMLLPSAGWCADFVDSAARLGRSQLRQAQAQRAAISPLLVRDKATVALTLGVAVDRDEADTTLVATPFEWSWTSAGQADWWRFAVGGDGLVRVKERGAAVQSGLADLDFNVAHPLTSNLIAVGGLVAPTHGDVGSTAWSQYAAGVLLLPGPGALSGQIVVGLVRPGEQVDGLGRYAKVLRGELGLEVTTTLSAAASLSRAHRSGAKGATDLGLDLMFPISGRESKVSFVRGLTTGSRHTSIGFELALTF